MKKLLLALFVATPAVLLPADAFAVTAQFPVTRDVGIQGHGSEQASSAGLGDATGGRIRAWKSNQNTVILDFDSSAMGAFLAANPGTATWTLNLHLADNNPAGDVSILTVESTNDWTEGDANWNGANFNWTAGTTAATYFYAQTAYTPAGAATQVDIANSLAWIDPDSGPYSFTKRNFDGSYGAELSNDGDPTPAFTNSADFLVADLSLGGLVSVALDSDIANAIINDVNNRGLRLGAYANTGGSNMRMYGREASGGTLAAYLEVTVIPEPSSMLLLLVGTCFVSRRR